MRKSLQFLGFLTDGDIDWLLDVGEVDELCAGDTLVMAGQVLDSVYVLVDGRLTLADPDHAEAAKSVVAGEVVGQISAKPAPATATAELPSRVLRVRRSALVQKCDEDAGFSERFEHVVQSLVSKKRWAANVQAPPGPITDWVRQRSEIERAISLKAMPRVSTIDWIVAMVNCVSSVN